MTSSIIINQYMIKNQLKSAKPNLEKIVGLLTTMDRHLEYCVLAAIIAMIVITSFHQLLPIQ
jgi:hypothetical protein